MHSDQPAFTSTTGGVDELEALLTAQRLSFLASSLAVDPPEMLRNGISAFRAALNPRRLPVASPLSTETLPTHEASPSQESTVLAGGDKSASSGPTRCMCKDGPGIDTLQIQLDAIQLEVLRGSNQMDELIQSMAELKTEIQAIHAALKEPKTTAFRALDASPPVIISPAPIRPPSLEGFGHTVRQIETPRVEPSSSPVIVSRSFSPGLQSVKQSVATTPVTTPYTTSTHLPGITTRTATPIITCPPSQSRFGSDDRVSGRTMERPRLQVPAPFPTIPLPQEVGIGWPTPASRVPSVTRSDSPRVWTASHRSCSSSPCRRTSPPDVPTSPFRDRITWPSNDKAGVCTCKTIRRINGTGSRRESNSTVTCDNCLAKTRGRSPASISRETSIERFAASPVRTVERASRPPSRHPSVYSLTPEIQPLASPSIRGHSIPRHQAWSPEPWSAVPASLPLDRACSTRSPSPSLPGVRVPLAKNGLGTVTYPEGIQAASKKLDGTILGGSYKYDREFLLQFKLFCRDKPQFSSNLDGLGVERPAPLTENDLSHSWRTQGSMGGSIQGGVDGSGGLDSGSISPGGVAGQLPTRTRVQHGRQEKVSPDPNTSSLSQPQEPVHEPTLESTKAAASLRACENPWAPWSVGWNKRAQGRNSLEFTERKVQALLNKLTSKNFDSILGQVLGLANTSEDEKKAPVLDWIAKSVFEQACETPRFAEVLARLSKEITVKLPASVQDGNVKNSSGEPITEGHLFRKYLVGRCQENTERSLSVARTGLSGPSSQDDKVVKVRSEGEANDGKPASFPDEYYAIQKAKRQSLNLTRFLGELCKVQMLTERIMHELIKIPLVKIYNPEEDKIEMLCMLVTTVGKELDTPKAQGHFDIYFGRMQMLVDNYNNTLPSRLRCMLLDVIDLRKRNWGPRERTAQLREQQS